MRVCILASVLCILASIAGGQPQPGFDPKDVVRHVRQMPNPELRLHGNEKGPGISPTEARIRRDSPTHNTPHPTPDVDDGEFLLDTTLRYLPLPAGENPEIASDGTNYLVVWEDTRADLSHPRLFGARVSASGILRDSTNIKITTTDSDQWEPAVVFDGQNYVVVWGESWRGMCAARVSPAGVVLDPQGVVFAPGSYGGNPAIAFDGSNYLVVWTHYRESPYFSDEIQGLLINRQFQPLSPGVMTIANDSSWQANPRVAYGGDCFLVTWEYVHTLTRIFATRVSRAGAILDSGGVELAPGNWDKNYPCASFADTTFLLVWSDSRSTPGPGIYGTHITQSGIVFEPNGVRLTIAQGQPDIAFGGTEFFISWYQYQDTAWEVCGTRMTLDGHVANPQGVVLSAGGYSDQRLAFNGSGYLITWGFRSEGIHAARASLAGDPMDSMPVAVSCGSNIQSAPASSASAQCFLTAWEDDRSGNQGVYAARVSFQGVLQDQTPIPVSMTQFNATNPAIASDGQEFLIVWTDYRDGTAAIRGSRISESGEVLDPQGLMISRSGGAPSVTYDGTDYLVVSAVGVRIVGTRVTLTGEIVDSAGITINSSPCSSQQSPRVASTPTQSLIVWDRVRYHPGPPDPYYSYELVGSRISADGRVLDTLGISISGERLYDVYSASLAFDGANYLVIYPCNGTDNGFFGKRVSTAGSVLDPNGLRFTADGSGLPFALAFDVPSYLIVFNAEFDLWGIRVTPDGQIVDSFSVVSAPWMQTQPCLTISPAGQSLLVYQGWTASYGGRNFNSMRVWGKFGRLPGIEEAPSGEVRTAKRIPTIVRGLLDLSGQRLAVGGQRFSLLDISGRKILDLSPGPNDVSRLAPGVYFIRESTPQAKAMRVVVTK